MAREDYVEFWKRNPTLDPMPAHMRTDLQPLPIDFKSADTDDEDFSKLLIDEGKRPQLPNITNIALNNKLKLLPFKSLATPETKVETEALRTSEKASDKNIELISEKNIASKKSKDSYGVAKASGPIAFLLKCSETSNTKSKL